MNEIGKGLSLGGVQGHNRHVILKTLHDIGNCSRKEISVATGLDQATITRAIGSLIDEGIVEEVGLSKGGRGRRSIHLDFCSKGRHILCLRLQRRSFSIAIFNLRGDPITSEEIPIPRGQPAEDIFENIVNIMQKQVARFKKIDGIGIAVPGPFLESDERVILITESPEWQGFQLIPELRTRFPNLPLFSIHDAKAAALTEWRNKLPRNGAKVLLYVSAGQGIGSALVIDGEVYRGAVGLAGEMGHMSIQADGDLCKCGNIGCLELYASRISLLRAVREKETPRLKSHATFSDVVHAYLDSDPVAISEVHRIASYLAQGITNCVNFTNPDLIVIGDEYALFGDRFLDEIKSQIEKRLLPSVFSSVDVKLSEVTQDTVLAGTFLDVFSQTYLGVAREIYHTVPTESV